MTPLGRLISWLGVRVASLRAQCLGRFLSKSEREVLREQCHGRRTFLVFASSAGEYEQALPLVKRFEADHPDLLPVLIFFSESGVTFAKSQGESRLFCKAPWDDYFAWRLLLKAIEPQFTIVVRYELWPNFLYQAKSYGPVYLVNGVESPRVSRNRLVRLVKRRLIAGIDRIFVVGSRDQDFFLETLGASREQIVVTGDTKYDRVRERAEERQAKLSDIQGRLNQSWPRRNCFILGSAWHKDVQLGFDSFKKCGKTQQWRLIVAPHDISSDMLAWVESQAKACDIQLCKFTQLDQLASHHDGILVDVIGVLPELYGCAELAMVGGAMHHRVHNVLEPAVRGLYLCFGPLYHTSKEAEALVSEQLAKVVTNSKELTDWWQSLSIDVGDRFEQLVEHVNRMTGASDRIKDEIEKRTKISG